MSSQFETKLAEFVERGGKFALRDRLNEVVVERTDLLEACTTPHLCHYDFHSGNILAGRNDGLLRLSGVLDFESAIAGDPLMDIAKALYYFTPQDEPKKAALLMGYGALDRRTGRKPSIFIGCTPPWSWVLDGANRRSRAACQPCRGPADKC